MPPVFTETREAIVRGRISLPLPATAADLNEALAALDRRGVNATDVKVAAGAALLELSYETVETLGAPKAPVPAPMPMIPTPGTPTPMPTWPTLPALGGGIVTTDKTFAGKSITVSNTAAVIDGKHLKDGSVTPEKLAKTEEPAAPTQLTVKRAEKESTKTPFPTSLEERLPELTISNAHRLLAQPSGTYFLHLPAAATSREAQKLVQRVHTAAKSFRGRTGAEVLVETKRDRQHSAVAVTVLKADTPTG